MQIALFGATGQTGRRVLQRLLDRGDAVHALVRDPARLPGRPGLVAHAGDARDAAAVRGALDGAQAVVICLGMRDIAQPATDFSDSVRTIVDAARAAGVRRVLAIASVFALPDVRGGMRGEHAPRGPFANVIAARKVTEETEP